MKAFLKTTKGKIILGGAALLIILLLVLLITKVIGGEEGYRNISVSEISGSVMTENGGKKYEAYKNMRLADGFALTTDIASYTRMVLDSDKYVKLEEKSRALFEALGSDKQRKTAIRLEDGTLTTEITAPLGEDEDYIVNTPNAVLAVRGTFFKAVVRYDTNGDAYTDVYTYGGTVVCKRVMPDGTLVDEEVMITSGYKARVKMDEIITVYVEELIEEDEDNVDPIDINEVPDGDIVDVYNAAVHGHEMFAEIPVFWQEILRRDIDLNDYHSVYDGGEIPSYDEDVGVTETTEPTEIVTETVSKTETNASEASGEETDIPEEYDYSYDSTEGYYTAETAALSNQGTDSGREASPESRGESVTTARTESYTYTGPTEHTHSPYTEIIEDEPAVTEVTSVTTTETVFLETVGTEIELPVYTSVSHTTVSETVIVPDVTSDTHSTSQTDNTSQSGSGATGTVPTEPEVHVHKFEEYISDGNATCTEDGTKTAVCSCGEKDTVIDTGSAGHKEVREVTEATAVSEGHIHIYCSVCGETIADETMPRLPIYIDDGNLVISETGFSQGGGEEIPYTGDYNISQRSSTPAAYSITVVSGTHSITFNGINTSTASDTFTVEKGASAVIFGGNKENRLSASGSNCYGLYVNGGSAAIKSGIFNFSGSCGIFGTADSVISVSGGYISANGTSDGIRNSGAFSVSGGSLSAHGSDNGIWNNGDLTAVGGSLSADGGSKDVKTWKNAVITGGSIRAVNNNIDGAFTNSIGDELECKAFDVFPSETIRTFENSNGDNYVYGLAPEDKSSDGYYYVWKPKDFTPKFDGTVYMDDGSVTITADGITQDGKTFPWTEDITISQKDRSTVFDVKIAVESGTHNITFDGVNINSSSGSCVEISSRANVVVSGSFKENIIASAQERAVNNSGTLRIDSGAFKLSGGYCGIYNASQAAVNGGRISVSGGVCDIFSEESGTFTVSGGSMKSEKSAVGGKITNPSGDELECKVYSEYTGNLTFKDGDGNEYTYKLDIGDSIDGGYYVWQPKGAVPEGVELSEENFPDPVFREYVLENFDTDSDGYLSDSEIEAVTEIDVSGEMISSLNGIEYLTALTHLNCEETQITSLYVSNNTALTYLNCGGTQITSLDISKNTALTQLNCGGTQITSLDVSKNTALTGLFCGHTQITSLDVSKNTALADLLCAKTKISHVDISNNPNITSFFANDCKHPITVTNGKFDTKTIAGFDHTRVSNLKGAVMDENGVLSRITNEKITYTYDCGQGKSETFILLCDIEPVQGVEVNEENFPDEVFRNYVSDRFDTDGNGYLSEEEIAGVTEINVSGSSSEDGGITDLIGIEHFKNLQELNCYYNQGLTSLDVSKNTALTTLYCYSTDITSLDVSKNVALIKINCVGTNITSLNVSKNTALQWLSCNDTSITNLDVSKNTALTTLYCYRTDITSLDVNKNTVLETLWCFNTGITSLDVSNNADLMDLRCYNCSRSITVANGKFDTKTIDGFDHTKISNLKGATKDDNGVLSDITEETNITYTYDCGRGNSATFTLVPDDKSTFEPEETPFNGTLDLSTGAVTITADGFVQNGVTTPWTGDYTITGEVGSSAITIESGKHNIILEDANISADGYGLTIAEDAEVTLVGNGTFTGISVSGTLNADNCEITSEGQYGIYISGSGKVSIDSGSFELYGENSGIFCSGKLEISGGSVNADGGQYGILNSSNGVISVSGGKTSISGGADDIYSSGEFAVTGGSVRSENGSLIGSIANADGAELECAVFDTFPSEAERTFTNPDGSEYIYRLTEGDRADDGKYYVWKPKAAPVPTGVELSEENFPDEVFRDYILENFDTDSNGYLSDSEIEAVTSIDVSGTSSSDGGVASLKGIEHFDKLKTLVCCFNSGLTSLDLSNNTALTELSCYNSQITSLDVSNNTALTRLYCFNTQITSLNVSNNTALKILYCDNTQITSLDVSNNTALNELRCSNTKIPYVDITNNMAVITFEADGCEHPITVVDGVFDTKTIDGFDYTRVSDIVGAVMDENGVLSGITEGTNITYTYDCGRDKSATFTLVPDENSTFDTEEVPFDGTLDLNAGPVTITAEGFVQNDITTPWTGDYIITQEYGSSAITIESGKHNIILEDASISADGYGLTIAEGAEVTLSGSGTFSGISVSGTLNTDNCNIVSEGQYGIYISGSGTVSIASGSFVLSGENSGIFCGGKLEISGGSVSAEGGQYGVMNTSSGIISVSGGTTSISGGTDDIYSSGELLATGGSVRAENGTVIGSILNPDGAELECVVFDAFPSEAERTFTSHGGSEYVYKLTEGDHAADGKYYVWKPKAVPTGVEVSEENFPDEVFRNYVSENFDTDGDGYLSQAERDSVKIINASSGNNLIDKGITSLKGIEYFTNLERIYCSYNSKLKSLDVNQNTKLKYIECSETNISELDTSNNTDLLQLICKFTLITKLNLSNNSKLNKLDCYSCPISELNLSQNVELTELNCSYTDIKTLDLSNNIKLKSLNCVGASIINLDVSNNSALTYLNCVRCQLPFVDISKNPNISDFHVNPSSYQPDYGNKHYITVTNCTFDLSTIDGFNVGKISNLKGAELTGTILSGITKGTNITYNYDCGQGYSGTFTLVPDENSTFESDDIAVNEENFPDEVFREYVSTEFDKDMDGYLSDSEIEAATSIDVSYKEIYSFQGIEHFTALSELYCDNTQITSLDVSNNTALISLDCCDTQITSLDISNNIALNYLFIGGSNDVRCPIASIDVSHNINLIELQIGCSQITSLNISNNTSLTHLECCRIPITSLDVSNNAALNFLAVQYCKIPYIDVTNTSVTGANFGTSDCIYEIPACLSFDINTDTNFNGFDPYKVSNVRGADFYPESGIFDNFTSNKITYDYDCGRGFTETFTLVRTGASISYEDEDDEITAETKHIPNDETSQDGSEETAQPDETEAAEDEETVSTNTTESTDINDGTTADELEQTEASGLSELLAAAAISAAAVSVNLMDIAIFSVNMIICLISILIKLWR